MAKGNAFWMKSGGILYKKLRIQLCLLAITHVLNYVDSFCCLQRGKGENNCNKKPMILFSEHHEQVIPSRKYVNAIKFSIA